MLLLRILLSVVLSGWSAPGGNDGGATVTRDGDGKVTGVQSSASDQGAQQAGAHSQAENAKSSTANPGPSHAAVVTVTVLDGSAAPVSGIAVYIYYSIIAVLGQGTTGSDGKVVINIDDPTYLNQTGTTINTGSCPGQAGFLATTIPTGASAFTLTATPC